MESRTTVDADTVFLAVVGFVAGEFGLVDAGCRAWELDADFLEVVGFVTVVNVVDTGCRALNVDAGFFEFVGFAARGGVATAGCVVNGRTERERFRGGRAVEERSTVGGASEDGLDGWWS